MKKRNIAMALLTVAVAIGTTTMAEEKQESTEKAEVKKQTTCPVMGGKIDKGKYADVKGYRIYVCCPGCIGKIKADPDKYIKKLQDEGITLEKTPKKEDAKGESHSEESDHSGHQH